MLGAVRLLGMNQFCLPCMKQRVHTIWVGGLASEGSGMVEHGVSMTLVNLKILLYNYGQIRIFVHMIKTCVILVYWLRKLCTCRWHGVRSLWLMRKGGFCHVHFWTLTTNILFFFQTGIVLFVLCYFIIGGSYLLTFLIVFHLLSSCVPLHNFDYVYNYLMDTNISFVDW